MTSNIKTVRQRIRTEQLDGKNCTFFLFCASFLCQKGHFLSSEALVYDKNHDPREKIYRCFFSRGSWFLKWGFPKMFDGRLICLSVSELCNPSHFSKISGKETFDGFWAILRGVQRVFCQEKVINFNRTGRNHSDKPLPLPGGTLIYPPTWLVYALIGVTGAGMGVSTMMMVEKAKKVGGRK